MTGLSKKFTFMLIFILVASGLFLVVPLGAEGVVMPEPSIFAPEVVSVVVYNDPIWEPPTYKTDVYTGVVTEYPGKWRQNGTIEVTIKNRPFTSYTNENGTYINVEYHFVWKAHFIEWDTDGVGFGQKVVNQSDSGYTVVSFPYGGPFTTQPSGSLGFFGKDSLLDFHVQAQIGYTYRPNQYSTDSEIYIGEVSEWSDTYTVTIPPVVDSGTSTPVAPPSPGTSSSDKPSTSDPYNLPPQNTLQPKPFWTNIIMFIVFVSVIAVLLTVIVYQYKQRRVSRR